MSDDTQEVPQPEPEKPAAPLTIEDRLAILEARISSEDHALRAVLKAKLGVEV